MKPTLKDLEVRKIPNFREVRKILRGRGIEVKKIKATLNGAQAYKIIGSAEHNPAAIYTAFDIRWDYQCGRFA